MVCRSKVCKFRFSTQGSFFLETQAIGGSREDVLTFNSQTLGDATSGTYDAITFRWKSGLRDFLST